MDSITQFALGACVGVAVLGRRIGPRRAALTGGLLGTLPDMDVFLRHSDPVDAFVNHRGWSHSLLVHAALTPVLGEIITRFSKALSGERAIAYTAVFLCLATHALLDALTIYGTRLFWPVWNEPVSVGSMFIIDPLYTIPLLVAVGWAMACRSWTPRYGKVLLASLGFTTAYLAWSLIAQQIVTGKANGLLADIGVAPDRLIATPTPFNTVFWRVVGIDGDISFNLDIPVFGHTENPALYTYRRNLGINACSANDDRIARIAEFSHGFYRIMVQDDEVIVADMRMGLTPNYAFRFILGRLEAGKLVPAPTRRIEGRGNLSEDLDWLIANLTGNYTIRPAEAAARTELTHYPVIARLASPSRDC
ncbi:MAG: metal-dependent hydrolase [Alphaproteobacteria bacterium]